MLETAEIITIEIPVALNIKTLTVQTEPTGAEIWINGVQASQTPNTFNILTGDTVTLELKMPGYQVYTDTISLHENMDLGKFWNLLAYEGTGKSKKELQDWITKNGLSSHMQVLVKKKK